MSLNPRIEEANQKHLLGMHATMSIVNNKTGELWQRFLQRRKQIVNTLTSDAYSLQVYPPSYFKQFDPTKEFEKWALVEVSSYETIPDEMERFDLQGGKYAVFDYKGSSTNPAIFQMIYTQWLPSSMFDLDHRPHFEVLGEKYKNDHPDSEEEIWIPVKDKI